MPPRWENYSLVSLQKVFETVAFFPVTREVSTRALRQGVEQLVHRRKIFVYEKLSVKEFSLPVKKLVVPENTFYSLFVTFLTSKVIPKKTQD